MELKFASPEPVDPALEHPMRSELIRVIRDADRGAPRSRQAMIGPSEIGGSCDRRLAMRIAAIEAGNRTRDPWPAIVGTGIHMWLQKAMETDNRHHLEIWGSEPWITETKVQVDPVIRGSSDVYHVPTGTVIDWKSMGETAQTKLLREGPSEAYRIQIQAYGLGFANAGYPVKNVALMFLRREGYLSKARYYEWPYEPAVAHRAVDRVYRLARQVAALRREHGPEMWHLIPCDVTGLCGFCPYFRKGVGEASSVGCPGG